MYNLKIQTLRNLNIFYVYTNTKVEKLNSLIQNSVHIFNV